MGNIESIPVVSQVKSGVQLVCGDAEGAGKTQEKFFHECPVVSQATSVGYLIAGDGKRALETQKRCGQCLLNAADGIPVLGHAKGIVHYAVGDKEGGHRAMKSATRTTGVLVGGAGGFLLGGPPGAVVGGIYGGAATDLGTSVVTGRPSGYVAAIENAVKNPNPGDIFDLCFMPVADGIAGHSAGSVVKRLTAPRQPNVATAGGSSGTMPTQIDLVKAGELRAEAMAMYEATEANSLTVPEIQTLTEMNKVTKLWQAADVLEGKVQASVPKVVAPKPAVSPPATVCVNSTESGQKRRQVQQRTQRRRQVNETSDSSESEDEECTCKEINVPVVYANMGSINPKNKTVSMSQKIERLKAIIERNNPAIIAIVETWLNQSHDSANVADKLGLPGYTIWRQDRCEGHPAGNDYGDRETGMEGRRGGGILIAWSPSLANGTTLLLERKESHGFGDNIMSADIIRTVNCKKCNDQAAARKFGFTVVYRRPVPSNDTAAENLDADVIGRLIDLGSEYTKSIYSGWSFVGDFNFKNGSNNKAFDYLLAYTADTAKTFPDPSTATHQRGGCLDLVIASDQHVEGVVVSPEPISDHHALVYELNLGVDFDKNRECKACKND